ncbi:MAG TPA: amino acid ABC transporter permease [Ruminococcaceae bacterium]|jgi:polar amino acid transport system permease protein|nr:amino acid ABC transporter permease [Oscillospiraceae bacterium]
MPNYFDIETVFTKIPQILAYLPVTLELAVISMVIALILGLLIAIIRIKNVPVLEQISTVYISVIRGTPILVQLYVSYFGIPIILKYINYYYHLNLSIIAIPSILYAYFALSVNQSAFNAETLRSALQSVNKGQIEAASALGMTYFQTLRRIIIPEASVVALPNLCNSFIGLIKGTSLAFTCSVVEMTAEGKILAGRDFRYFEVYVSLALIYWVITIFIERISKVLERKLSIPDTVSEDAYSEVEK